MDTVIAVEHLHKRYGAVPAVTDISFAVRRGEIFGLLGPNGAGKTTTVEMLQGLRHRDSGRVSVLGLDPDVSGPELRRRIGSQLQSAALPARLRVGEAVELFGHLASANVDATLAEWDLGPLRRRPFAALSGGQRQRLFLALALLGEPDVVFLDELTTGLDPHARRRTWDLVSRVRDRGATVVIVTHFMEEAEALCDRVAIIDGGRVVELGEPSQLAVRHGNGVRMTFGTDGRDVGFLAGLPGVTHLAQGSETAVVTGSASSVVGVAAALASRGLCPPDFRTHHPNLEDLFLNLTGRSLGNGDPT